MQNLVRSKTIGVTGNGGRGTAGAGPGRDLLYNLNIGLFVGVNNYGQSVVMGQAIVVGEKTGDFEYQFTHWLAAVGIAPVVMFTDA